MFKMTFSFSMCFTQAEIERHLLYDRSSIYYFGISANMLQQFMQRNKIKENTKTSQQL